MTTHSSASMREEALHVTETTNTIISNALKRRAQSVINDTSIDPQWRAIVRYGLETNDPWLADLVRRADAGELIVDTIDFSLEPGSQEDDSSDEKIEARGVSGSRAIPNTDDTDKNPDLSVSSVVNFF